MNPNRKDISGSVFGRLTVVRESPNIGGKTAWVCACVCGKSHVARTTDIVRGLVNSCGCAKAERAVTMGNANKKGFKAGERFGRLVVSHEVEPIPRLSGGVYYRFLCLCDCGGKIELMSTRLRSGTAISCGCASVDHPGLTPQKRKSVAAAHTSKRRARKLSAIGSFTAQEIERLKLFQRGRCACCREKLGDDFQRDHKVPLSKGGGNDILNIELLCPQCNLRKHAKDPIDWANENGLLL